LFGRREAGIKRRWRIAVGRPSKKQKWHPNGWGRGWAFRAFTQAISSDEEADGIARMQIGGEIVWKGVG